MRPEFSFRIAPNCPQIGKMTMTSQFVDMTSSSICFWRFVALVKFSYWSNFIRGWPEIRKSEIPPSEFCPICGDWGKWGIPNLARISVIKMLLNTSKCQGYTAFTVSDLSRENQHGVGGRGGWVKLSPPD